MNAQIPYHICRRRIAHLIIGETVSMPHDYNVRVKRLDQKLYAIYHGTKRVATIGQQCEDCMNRNSRILNLVIDEVMQHTSFKSANEPLSATFFKWVTLVTGISPKEVLQALGKKVWEEFSNEIAAKQAVRMKFSF